MISVDEWAGNVFDEEPKLGQLVRVILIVAVKLETSGISFCSTEKIVHAEDHTNFM